MDWGETFAHQPHAIAHNHDSNNGHPQTIEPQRAGETKTTVDTHPKETKEMNREPEDGIPTVLENDISSMNARDSRYAWISVRTDQVNGTLSKLSRVDLSNPDDTALEDIK